MLVTIRTNETDHFGLVRLEMTFLKVVHFDRSVPSIALLYPAYENNNQTRGGLGRVCETRNVSFHWARDISEISNRNFC